jgi:NhaA family Na+:H+ antiporter
MSNSDDGRSILSVEEHRHDPHHAWFGPHRPVLSKVARPVVGFLEIEAAGGLVLLLAALAALIWANSPWQEAYRTLWSTTVGGNVGNAELSAELRDWVNDGLMVLFFFVVGLEIKSELVEGELASVHRAALPAAAALGGMIAPAGVYLAVNATGGDPQGWGVAIATDIAFAYGIVKLLGDAVPSELRILVLAMAIVDDIGAILVIAVFYTSQLSVVWLATAAALVAVIVVTRRLRVWYIPLYIALGAALWLATYNSGVHATVAGVALGLLTPARPLLSRQKANELVAAAAEENSDPIDEARRSAQFVKESVPVADRLNAALHRWTSFAVIPVFALANTGITIDRELVTDAVTNPVPIGIAAGLVLGKPLGVVGMAWLATHTGITSLPGGVRWRHLTGLGFVAGIGFTMSLFVSELAFGGGEEHRSAKLGILAGSVLAALVGAAVLRGFRRQRQ